MRAESLDLLPWATLWRLSSPLDSETAALEVLAHVCVELHGTPGALIEGRAIA
jgi:hypothetical protein